MNSLVIRTQCRKEQSFIELIQNVRKGVLDDFSNSELPFERLVAEIKPERNPSYNPLFQSMFTLNKAVLSPITFRK